MKKKKEEKKRSPNSRGDALRQQLRPASLPTLSLFFSFKSLLQCLLMFMLKCVTTSTRFSRPIITSSINGKLCRLRLLENCANCLVKLV